MQVYNNVPWVRIIFLAFTILFHFYLLIRSAVEGRYLISAILVIPVIAVSVALFKLLKRTIISAFLNGHAIEFKTAFERFSLDTGEVKIEGSELLGAGRKFLIDPKKAGNLIEVLKKNIKL